MVVVEELEKSYGKLQAVNKLSFQVGKGRIFGFVGPNGAGKTTTLKILATLLAPTAGRAWIAGEEVTANPGRVRRLMGYMPDFFGVYDDLKVGEYLDFYGASYDIAPAKRRKIADDLLELVDLAHKKNTYVDSLSRGMKQRLCLARSLVHDPAVLLLDEPASGLDPRARVEMRELLKELRNMGKTILISSHILPELAELCTEVGIVENGELVISGSVEDIMFRVHNSRILQVRVLDRAEVAAELLRQYPGVGEVVQRESLLEVSFAGSEAELGKLLRTLVQHDFPVTSFAEAGHNLEDLFMQVTKGVIQ